MSRIVCHLTSVSEWAESVERGRHAPVSFTTEGFLHFSTPDQLCATALRYYRGANDLLALCVTTDSVADDLRFERPTVANSQVGDQLFPHLYRPLRPDEVVLVEALPVIDDAFQLPEAVASLAGRS